MLVGWIAKMNEMKCTKNIEWDNLRLTWVLSVPHRSTSTTTTSTTRIAN
jgi:hypothetical protein